jgi:2'-5' RNA ligase
MLTFRQYIIESANGNYVSTDVATDLPNFGLDAKYPDANITPRIDQHVTLIYSKETNIPLGKVEKFLKTCPQKFTATIKDVAAFDSVPKDGERDESKCAIVLKLDSSDLKAIHDGLKGIGLKHSYPDFSPHITLIYGFPRDQKEECMKFIKDQIKDNMTINLKHINNNKIIKDWAEKLEK